MHEITNEHVRVLLEIQEHKTVRLEQLQHLNPDIHPLTLWQMVTELFALGGIDISQDHTGTIITCS